MDTQNMTVSELREHLVEKATADETFRAHLLSDPKAAIKEELGLTIPEGFTVKVLEDVPDTSHLVLPPYSGLGEGELSQAAGGGNNDEAATFWD